VKEAVREVPLSRPWLDEREEELVLEVLRSGRLSLGPWIEKFEEQIAERVGAPYAAAVSSGTAGLHLMCRIAGLGPGDEVITSPLSFVASANCFIVEGATPVFADVDPVTLNMDPAAVEAAVTERTRGIVAVDMFGYPCELDELRAIADRHGLALIEDACESLGAEYRGHSAHTARPRCSRSTRTSRWPPAKAGSSSRTRRRSGGSCAACAIRGARTTEAAAGSTTSASV
jgi:perosamine synthetase